MEEYVNGGVCGAIAMVVHNGAGVHESFVMPL